MKITNYDKNHGKFVHEDWLQKIINLVPNLVQLTDAKSIEAIHFDNNQTTVDYIDENGELVEGEHVADYLISNLTGWGDNEVIHSIQFDTAPTDKTVVTGVTLTDYDQHTYSLPLDKGIRYAFDNSGDKFIATDKQLGIVKYSKTNPTRVDADGTINTHYDGTGIGTNANHDLSLLPATDTTLGGVMPDGDTIVANDGVLTSLAHYNIYTNKVVAHALDETITLNATNYIKQLQIAYSGNGEEAFLYVITDVAIDLTTPNTEIASDTPIIGFASPLTAKTNSLIPLVSADKKVYHLYYYYDATGSKIKTVEPLPANAHFTYVGTV